MPAFYPFYESIRNLPPNAREEQEKKVYLVLNIALKQLQKRLNVCIKKLLFLSLYSEGPTAQCVAIYLLSDAENLDPQIQASYDSSIHNNSAPKFITQYKYT